jgi:hypothetical protein
MEKLVADKSIPKICAQNSTVVLMNSIAEKANAVNSVPVMINIFN